MSEYQQPAICSTLNNIPMTASTLQKSRLPFAIHLYPFANGDTIAVSSEGPIVRCSICRAFINPYVRIGESRSWQCNICDRLNELPPDFIYDYTNQRYHDLGSKIELTRDTVEYIAGAEYMVRPPQPACYVFVFDCSKAAYDLGYISIMASDIADLLDSMPGDARTSVGFIAFDSAIHYFSFSGSLVVHHVSTDLSAEILPCSNDGLLANKASKREMILDFLTQTLSNFPMGNGCATVTDNNSALGPAIKAAIKLMYNIGGRITILQAKLPNRGGTDDNSALTMREDTSLKNPSSKNGEYLTPLINPATDFYKNLALECSDHQISIDLFNLSTSYSDLATVAPLIRISSGTIYHYSNSPNELNTTLLRFDQDFRNHLVRQIGLEAVLRLRYSRGLKIHTFHGNFFVRSTNLLVLPNVNPESSFALQIAIEDDLRPDTRHLYFQTSLLYTTPDAERRIRVCTARYPTANTLPEVIYGANQTAIVAMLAKMAVDRSMQASVGEAKEALIGAAIDMLEIYAIADEMRVKTYGIALPENLRLIPLYVLAILKHQALKLGSPVKLDDRVASLERFKTLPVDDLITYIYPDLFALHNIANDPNEDWKNPIQLTAAHLERHGAYLLDAYDVIIIYVCEYIDPSWCYDVFGVNEYAKIREYPEHLNNDLSNQSNHIRPRDPANFTGPSYLTNSNNQSKDIMSGSQKTLTAAEIAEVPLIALPELENVTSNNLREFINYLIEFRPQKPKFFIIKEKSRARTIFTQYLIDDRSENYHSYAEFWKFLLDQARR